MHFTEGKEPSPQKSQSGQGVWLRDLGSDLCALCEKRFSSEKCDCCGLNGEGTAEGGESAAEEAKNAKRRQRDQELNR